MMYKLFVSFAALAVAVSASATQMISFDQYAAKYGKNYSPEERAIREDLFNARAAEILAHNSNPSKTWTLGFNKFTDMTESEQAAFRGHSKALGGSFKQTGSLRAPPASAQPPPQSRDWRDATDVVSAVKNQGGCGSCWAFSATESIESHAALATGKLYELAPQQLVDCVENPYECGGTGGCEGATAELAFAHVSQRGFGLALESDYAYTAQDGTCKEDNIAYAVQNVSGFVTLGSNDYQPLLDAVGNVGPISVSVDASKFSMYSGGIFDGCNQDEPDINHAVQLVGYGEDAGQAYWLVRNSWGADWGEKGYIRLLRNDAESTRCGIDDTPMDGSACKGGPSSVEVCGTCGILFDSAYPIVGH